MMKRMLCALVLVMLTTPAFAEKLFVSERLATSLRAAPDPAAPVVKMVGAGSAVEVLERNGALARVRDAEGGEGWIAANLLVTDTLRAQADRQKAELDQLRAKLKQAEQALATAQQAPAPAPAPAAAPALKPEAAAKPAAPDDDSWFSLGWALFSFAMLTGGFFGGVYWLRETWKRRMGGMYLRI
jgi:hypothetical protein